MSELYCGIDFHKKKSYLYAINEEKKEVIDIEILSSRICEYLSPYSEQMQIAIEATGGANHLATKLVEMGFEVVLVETNQFHPRNKKRGRKTDREDAVALSKYLRMEELPEVYLKSLAARQLKTLLVQREHLVNQRRNMTNHIRGILREYGYVIPVGVDSFFKNAGGLIDKITSIKTRELLKFYLDQARLYLTKEEEINQDLTEQAHQSAEAARLMTIPGFGPLTALCFIAVVDEINRFPDARKFGAYLGLVPREFSSGGKQRLGAITRSGPEMLRRYMIHGARSVLMRSGPRLAEDPNKKWAERVQSRSNTNKAVVALAHKNARIAFGLMKHQSDYDPKHARKLNESV